MSKPTKREVQMLGEEVIDIIDATRPFKYTVARYHVWGSNSKAANILSHCVQDNAILDNPGVIDCKFLKSVAYVIFKNNPHHAIRYNPTSDGQKIAEINDDLKMGGKKKLLAMLKNPIELWLMPPRHSRSLKHLRSPEMKQVRKESAERRKGQEPRPYTSPSKRGFRNGTGIGKAHMWPRKNREATI